MYTNDRAVIALKLGRVKVPILRHYVSVSILLLLCCEAMIFVLAHNIAMVMPWGSGVVADVGSRLHLFESSLFAVIMVGSLAAQGLYRVRSRYTDAAILARLLVGFIIGSAGFGALAYIFSLPTLQFGGGTAVQAITISFLFVLMAHTLFFRTVDLSGFKSKVLVLGAGRRASSLAQLRRKSDQRTSYIVGFVRCDSDDAQVSTGKVIDIDPASLASYALKNDIDEILVAPDDRRVAFPAQQLLACKMHGINIIELSAFFERETGKIQLNLLHPSWLIFAEGFDLRGYRALVKRLVDIAFALPMLVAFAPVMAVVALGIMLESSRGESIFYRQRRVGLNGKNFEILKFRSMVSNAETDGRAQWAQADDQRVTRVGKFIRKYRLDELPQLLNVLKGDMSLVGPRPERPEFVSKFRESIPYYNERHFVKPGITGWAQLNYPYGASEKDAVEKLQFDLYYVKNNSLLLDVAILLQTAEVVFFRKGSR